MATQFQRVLPPLLAVRAFEATARHLSFSVAADELHVTQSAVSRQVKLLEEFLGYRLFERMTRRIALTVEGAQYFAAVEASLDLLEQATVRGRGAKRHTTLKLSITQSLGTLFLLPRLASFSEVEPDTDVQITTSSTPVDFKRDDIDAAIRLGPLPGTRYQRLQPRIPHELVHSWRGVSAIYLWDEVLTPVMSRKLLREGPPVLTARDLLQHRLLHISPRPTAWADWFRTQGETLPANAASSEFGHFFMAMDAARAGQGVALAPTLLLCGPGGSGLVEPIKSDVPSAGAYYLLCRQKDAADARLGRLIAWLQAQATVPLRRPRKGTPRSASPSASQ